MEGPAHKFEFMHEDDSYVAEVWHYSHLSIKERLDHGITENCYLVYLKGPHEFKPFEVFIAEDLEWHTKSTFIVDDEIVQKIGLIIHNKSM